MKRKGRGRLRPSMLDACFSGVYEVYWERAVEIGSRVLKHHEPVIPFFKPLSVSEYWILT